MYRYLSGKLRQLGIRQKDLAVNLGISKSQVSMRFNGWIPWKINEMYTIMDIIQAPPEELHIYFPPKGSAA